MNCKVCRKELNDQSLNHIVKVYLNKDNLCKKHFKKYKKYNTICGLCSGFKSYNQYECVMDVELDENICEHHACCIIDNMESQMY